MLAPERDAVLVSIDFKNNREPIKLKLGNYSNFFKLFFRLDYS